ncbi:MAG TPA: organomercurial lyase [Phycisphaerae bacterium]|nr:organomercurial lyase [Phycisphaerae bacterium]
MADKCCGPLTDLRESVKVRLTYWYILEAFPRLGGAPTIEDMQRELLFPRDEITSILNALVAKGALRVEPASHMILDAYPYSGVPTRHPVELDKGASLYCMCAVDAFYVPFLVEHDLTIRSHCFFCRSEIEVRVERRTIAAAESAHVVIWNSAASYDCPKTNFFCCEAHLLEWRESAPDEQGQIYTLAEALDAGRRAAERMQKSREGLHEIQWAKPDELVCYCRQVPKATIVAAITEGVSSPEEIAKRTTACTGGWCEETNPKGRCCCVDLRALLEVHSEQAGR